MSAASFLPRARSCASLIASLRKFPLRKTAWSKIVLSQVWVGVVPSAFVRGFGSMADELAGQVAAATLNTTSTNYSREELLEGLGLEKISDDESVPSVDVSMRTMSAT